MMPHDLTLLILALAPFLVLTALRINAAFVFLSLCLGAVLVQYVADDVNSFLGIFAAHINAVGTSTVRLVLLFAPAALTAVFMLFSIHGRMRAMLNVLPAAAASLFAVLLAVPLLAPGMRSSVESQHLWHQLVSAQSLVIGLGAVFSLFFMWAARKKQKVSESRGRR